MYGVICSLEFHNTSKESWKCSREEEKQSWKRPSTAGTLPALHLHKHGWNRISSSIQLLLVIHEGKKTGPRKCRALAQGTEEVLSVRLGARPSGPAQAPSLELSFCCRRWPFPPTPLPPSLCPGVCLPPSVSMSVSLFLPPCALSPSHPPSASFCLFPCPSVCLTLFLPHLLSGPV